MCTKPPGRKEDTKFDIKSLELRSQKNKIHASDIFFSKDFIYKSDDYHCLAPNSHRNASRWKNYDLEKYRTAYDEETLKKVPTYKYDNRLYNFVDPKVWKLFTKSEKVGRRTWRKVYGFQYAKQIRGFNASKIYKTLSAFSCLKKCISLENSKSAKDCKKKGGYFKCCITYWWLDPYEEARNKLISDGLIKAEPTEVCKPYSLKNPCLYCSTNTLCTISDPITKETRQNIYPDKMITKGENCQHFIHSINNLLRLLVGWSVF